MKRLLLVLCLLICAAVCFGAEITKDEGKGYIIKGANYTAAIGKDTGNLSSLVFGGEEFLANGYDSLLPVYFFCDGYMPADTVTQEGNKIISVTNNSGTAVCTFDDNSVTLEVTFSDLSKAQRFFYLINDGVKSYIDKDKKAGRLPINVPESEYTFIKNDASMKVSGDAKYWGPWGPGLTVGEMTADRTLKTVFTDGGLSKAELSEIATNSFPALAAEKEDLVVYSPANYRVFQRSSKYEGQFYFSGKVNVPYDKVVYTITGKALNGKKYSGAAKEIKIDKVTGEFNEFVQGWAGGWYAVEIKAIKDKKTVASEVIENVGIGEVFVGAGQSNSTNYGQYQTKQTLGMSVSTDGIKWQIADDPMLGQHDDSRGGSYYPSLGDILYTEFQVPIAFASTGHGGTSIEAWLPGTELYNWFMKRVGQLGKNGFRAVLWHQGEANYNTPSQTSFMNMTAIINSSNYDAGWAFPWFVAKVSYHNANNPRWPLIRTAHQLLWNSGTALQGPDTDTLTGKMRDYDGGGIHFSPEGLKAHAELWAEKLIPYIHSCID